MSDLTIPARLMVNGAGLPDTTWECRSALVPRCSGIALASRGALCDVAWRGPEDIAPWEVEQNVRADELLVALTDQTAFGCALKLDEWERAGVPMWPKPDQYGFAMTWAERMADEPGNPVHVRNMIARLRVIGEDTMIRRSHGWPVKKGTLASVWRDTSGRWYMATDDDAAWWDSWPNITDPDEARTAIWREVCGG